MTDDMRNNMRAWVAFVVVVVALFLTAALVGYYNGEGPFAPDAIETPLSDGIPSVYPTLICDHACEYDANKYERGKADYERNCHDHNEYDGYNECEY